MSKLTVFILLIILILGGGYLYRISGIKNPAEKIYIAVEGESRISVIDPEKGAEVKTIDLSIEHDGERTAYAPHNVQVAPNGETVWITANAGSHKHASRPIPVARAAAEHEDGAHVDGHMDEHGHEPKDEIIVVSAATDRIVERIPIGSGLHLAHIVVSPDNNFAYATAQTEGAIYKIHTATMRVQEKISVKAASEPHGLRISPDGAFAYIAMLGGKSMGVLNLKDNSFREISLSGAAVQAGVTPDGKYAMVSVYDKKQLAIYDIASEKLTYIDLPKDSKGPVQMYPAPDSRFVYLADQGYYFGQPESDKVYKIDLKEMRVAAEIKAGRAPHGVVVDTLGKYAYITNLTEGSLSVIDTASGNEIGKIFIGKEPNGVSIWSKTEGGTP